MPSIDLSEPLLWAALAAQALYLTWLHSASRSRLPLPPGPRQLPLVGNLFDMATRPWEACMGWSKKYGLLIALSRVIYAERYVQVLMSST
jgi:hypothetical protein